MNIVQYGTTSTVYFMHILQIYIVWFYICLLDSLWVKIWKISLASLVVGQYRKEANATSKATIYIQKCLWSLQAPGESPSNRGVGTAWCKLAPPRHALALSVHGSCPLDTAGFDAATVHCGISNLGNSCWLSAVVQCYVAPFELLNQVYKTQSALFLTWRECRCWRLLRVTPPKLHDLCRVVFPYAWSWGWMMSF